MAVKDAATRGCQLSAYLASSFLKGNLSNTQPGCHTSPAGCYFAQIFFSLMAVQFTRCGKLNNASLPIDVCVLISRACRCVHKLKRTSRYELIKAIGIKDDPRLS